MLLIAQIYVPLGHLPTDYDYVLAHSWRIYRGEIPYKDFVYTKLPLGLSLHSAVFLLLEKTIVWASKFMFVLQLAAVNLLGLGLVFQNVDKRYFPGLVSFSMA